MFFLFSQFMFKYKPNSLNLNLHKQWMEPKDCTSVDCLISGDVWQWNLIL